jgi:hypothetical protein
VLTFEKNVSERKQNKQTYSQFLIMKTKTIKNVAEFSSVKSAEHNFFSLEGAIIAERNEMESVAFSRSLRLLDL